MAPDFGKINWALVKSIFTYAIYMISDTARWIAIGRPGNCKNFMVPVPSGTAHGYVYHNSTVFEMMRKNMLKIAPERYH